MPQKLLLGLLKTDIAPRGPKEAFKTFVKASENDVNLASINLFKIKNEIRRIRCEICSKLKILALRCSYRCSYKKVFWKYESNLQENAHAEVWLQ